MTIQNGWQNIKQSSSFSKSDTIQINGVKYLRPVLGKQYQLRPLGDLFSFKKYFFEYGGKWRSAICGNEQTCPVANKHNARPALKYAINVIDRTDGELKVFQSTPLTFVALQQFYKNYNKFPGKTHGAQFLLQTQGKQKISKYKLSLIGPHTLSTKDMQMIKNRGGIYPIQDLYKPTDPEKIQEILFGDISNSNNKINTIVKPDLTTQVDMVSQKYSNALSDLF